MIMYDKDFLRKLDQDKNRVTFAKVTRLSWEEKPQKEILGRITSGSIQIDGKSSTRRTFSLSMVAEDVNLSDYQWGLDTKMKLSIGLENHVDSNYPEIIWFEQGVYIITTFACSLNTSSYTINISGKDKMCLLDGTVGGALNSNVDFGKWEQETNLGFQEVGTKSFKKPVKDIIREAVHTFAREPFHNIIICDLPDTGYILQEYRYNTPLYMWRLAAENSKIVSCSIDGNIEVTYGSGTNNKYTLGTLPSGFKFESMNSFLPNDLKFSPSTATLGTKSVYLTKIEAGVTAGYIVTDLVYPDDLIENSGSSITKMLDKIVNFLGDYEYFYNLEGQFVFQKKKTYIYEQWNPLIDRNYEISAPLESQYSYEFNDSSMFTAINLNPNLLNVKNDYTVWGTKKSTDGSEFPIHMRIAIDQKPEMYVSLPVTANELISYNEKYGLDIKPQEKKLYVAQGSPMAKIAKHIKNGYFQFNNNVQGADSTSNDKNILTTNLKASISNIPITDVNAIDVNATVEYMIDNWSYFAEYYECDWRELIYQMSQDYNKFNHLDNFNQRLEKVNPQFKDGITGYEQYYIDMDGFWRKLYCPTDMDEAKRVLNLYQKEKVQERITELEKKYSKAEDTNTKESISEKLEIEKQYLKYFEDNEQFYLFNKNSNGTYTPISDSRLWWNRYLVENPSNLRFWIDFIEPAGDFIKFSVPAIGTRAKIESKNEVKAIAYLETPEIVFIDEEVTNAQIPSNYKQLQLGVFEDMLVKSSQGVSAGDAINSLLFKHTYCAENVSITAIPIYYLEPNTRIYINDPESGIEGDYLISSISLSLTYNGTMGLTVTKAPPILNYSQEV